MKIGDHKATPWIITDFETGGFEVEINLKDKEKLLPTHALTEIAMQAIKGDTLEEIGRYETLIKPYGLQYTEEAEKKTGLTVAKLEKEGKEIGVVFKEVCEFLEKANIYNSKTQYKPILVAQNAPFENKCYQHLFYMNKALKDLDKYFQCHVDLWGNSQLAYVDSLQFGRMMYAANIRVKNFQLETIAERTGIAMSDGHRAINDVIPTGEFLKHVIKRLRSSESVTEGEQSTVSFRDNFKFEY